jgi:hypothetical protein
MRKQKSIFHAPDLISFIAMSTRAMKAMTEGFVIGVLLKHSHLPTPALAERCFEYMSEFNMRDTGQSHSRGRDSAGTAEIGECISEVCTSEARISWVYIS